jgi:hypothetical protein
VKRIVAAAALLAACGSKAKPSTIPFADPDTLHGAYALLGLVPKGAERVIELDLRRLRENPSVGPLLTAWGARADLRAMGDLGFNPLLEADLLVLATYAAAEQDTTLVIARGEKMRAARIAGARRDASRLDDTTVVYGPAAHRERVVALTRGQGESVLAEDAFLRLRDEAIPKGAPGASLRATARFGFGRRVQLAGELGLDEMPGTASVWGDVADDVAIVGLFAASSEPSARRLADAIERLFRRDFSAIVPGAAFEARARGPVARVLFHVGPNALARLKTHFLAEPATEPTPEPTSEPMPEPMRRTP